MTTTARRWSCAVVVVLGVLLLSAGPVLAHGEGLTPYSYVAAPPGVTSAGTPQTGVSTQPLGGYGFAGTTDNQMQLTLPEGVLPPRAGERGVRVQLDQLDPAELPALPPGLEPEGNGYRVSLSYEPSGAPLEALAGPATLGLSAPAAPTAVYELVDGGWQVVDYTDVAVETGFSSVVALDGPGTWLQAYEAGGASPASPPPASLPPSPPPTSPPLPADAGGLERSGPVSAGPVAVTGVALLGALAVLLRRRTRATS